MESDKLRAADVRTTGLSRLAREEFATHVIRERSPGRWLLQRRNKDGRFTGIFATEVIALYGGELYVGGDIDHVVFSRYVDSGDPAGRVYWMGRRSSGADSYLVEKASIGSRELAHEWDEEVARDEVRRDWLDEEKRTLAEGWGDARRAAQLEELLNTWPEDKNELARQLYAISPDHFCDCGLPGTVPAARLFFAHAALARLCDLLDEERAAGERCIAHHESGVQCSFARHAGEDHASVVGPLTEPAVRWKAALP